MSYEDSDPAIAASWLYRLLKLVGWLVLLLAALLLFVLPATFTWLIGTGNYGATVSRWMRSVESLQIGLMHVVTLGWIFAVGGCLASFLNVVAWRVPRGRPITGSSHCPACDGRLAFFDNLPVIGWLRNEGQCRQCDAMIPVRYLVAELVLGTIFLILGAAAFFSGGANWPFFEVPRLVGFEHLLFSPAWQLISVLAWHLTLVCFLFTIMLIESEGLRVPRSIVVSAVVIVIGVALRAPEVWLVHWLTLGAIEHVVSGTASAMATAAIGGSVGWLVGELMRWAVTRDPLEPSAVPRAMILIGMFLGWQATFSVGVLTLVICALAKVFVQRAAARLIFIPAGCVLLATVVHLLAWNVLYA